MTFNIAHPDDPLQWALVDLNRVKVTAIGEFLWIRVLDVERALAARPWTADGQVVLAVDDPQGHAAGHFAIETSDGRAQVTRTDQPADVTLTAETLGSLYLGGPRVSLLHAAGRVHGTDEAVRRFAAMADLSRAALLPHGVLSRPSSRSTSAAASPGGARRRRPRPRRGDLPRAADDTVDEDRVGAARHRRAVLGGHDPRVLGAGPITQSSLPGSSTTDVSGRTSPSSGIVLGEHPPPLALDVDLGQPVLHLGPPPREPRPAGAQALAEPVGQVVGRRRAVGAEVVADRARAGLVERRDAAPARRGGRALQRQRPVEVGPERRRRPASATA